MSEIKTAKQVRIEHYGDNDARSYYPEEIGLMEKYHSQFSITDEEIEKVVLSNGKYGKLQNMSRGAVIECIKQIRDGLPNLSR